jgi:hypothetical protein
MAYNALRKVYGDVAGDPEAAIKLQQNSEATQLQPAVVEHANLANTELSISNDTNSTDLAMKKAQAQRDAATRAAIAIQGVPPAQRGEIFDKLVTPNADAWGIDAAHLPIVRKMLADPSTSEATLNHITSALQAPLTFTGATTYGTDANGEAVAIRTAKNGNVVTTPIPGVTPVPVAANVIKKQNANTSGFRANTAANNSTYGNDANAGADQGGGTAAAPAAAAPATTGGGPAVGSPQDLSTPVPGVDGLTNKGLDIALKRAGGDPAKALQDPAFSKVTGPTKDAIGAALYDRAKVYNSPAGMRAAMSPTAQAAANSSAAPANSGTLPPSIAHLPPKGRTMVIGQATQLANQGLIMDNMNTIMDKVDQQITPYTAGAGSLLTALPGGAQANLKANLATLKASGLMTWINSLKNAQGQTGIGRVLQSEANAASNLYGNMEQDQSAQQLRLHLQLFRRAVNGLYQNARRGFQQTWQTTPEEALGQPAPRAQAAAANAATGGNRVPYTPAQKAVADKYGIKL